MTRKMSLVSGFVLSGTAVSVDTSTMTSYIKNPYKFLRHQDFVPTTV